MVIQQYEKLDYSYLEKKLYGTKNKELFLRTEHKKIFFKGNLREYFIKHILIINKKIPRVFPHIISGSRSTSCTTNKAKMLLLCFLKNFVMAVA